MADTLDQNEMKSIPPFKRTCKSPAAHFRGSFSPSSLLTPFFFSNLQTRKVGWYSRLVFVPFHASPIAVLFLSLSAPPFVLLGLPFFLWASLYMRCKRFNDMNEVFLSAAVRAVRSDECSRIAELRLQGPTAVAHDPVPRHEGSGNTPFLLLNASTREVLLREPRARLPRPDLTRLVSFLRWLPLPIRSGLDLDWLRRVSQLHFLSCSVQTAASRDGGPLAGESRVDDGRLAGESEAAKTGRREAAKRGCSPGEDGETRGLRFHER